MVCPSASTSWPTLSANASTICRPRPDSSSSSGAERVCSQPPVPLSVTAILAHPRRVDTSTRTGPPDPDEACLKEFVPSSEAISSPSFRRGESSIIARTNARMAGTMTWRLGYVWLQFMRHPTVIGHNALQPEYSACVEYSALSSCSRQPGPDSRSDHVTQPVYVRIADDLRQQIIDGRLGPGDKVPSRHQLAAQYEVSDRVAVEAVRLLISEGFVTSRSGSGTYVRERPPVQRLTRSWYREVRGGSPFRADMVAQGRAGDWQSSSEVVTASRAIAERLGLAEGDPVMRTHYTFLADGLPVMSSTSWEPLALTGETSIMFPEDGPMAGRGVVERMAAAGIPVTHAQEIVTSRPLIAAEADELETPPGTLALIIRRTYSGDVPVETADIVVPVDRYELAYVIPVGEEED
jgi:DNA-binding GntR family transcriptional regulator